eukprot:919210_1
MAAMPPTSTPRGCEMHASLLNSSSKHSNFPFIHSSFLYLIPEPISCTCSQSQSSSASCSSCSSSSMAAILALALITGSLFFITLSYSK